LAFIIRIYHNAQSSEFQIDPKLLGWERYTDMLLSGFLVTQLNIGPKWYLWKR